MDTEALQVFWAALQRGEFITDASEQIGTYRKQARAGSLSAAAATLDGQQHIAQAQHLDDRRRSRLETRRNPQRRPGGPGGTTRSLLTRWADVITVINARRLLDRDD